MDIREQIEKFVADLTPGESILALGTMIDMLKIEMEKMSKENHQIFSIPVDNIDLFPKVRTAVKKLIREGVIKVGEYNDSSFDRTHSYAFTSYGKDLMKP